MAKENKSFFEKMRDRLDGGQQEKPEENIEDRAPRPPEITMAQERYKRVEAMYGPEEYEELEEPEGHTEVDGIVSTRFRYTPENYDASGSELEYEEIDFISISGSTILDEDMRDTDNAKDSIPPEK